MGFFARLKEDLDAARSHDPAARGSFENFFAYSGLHAIWIHRLTHRLWQNPGLRFPARLLFPNHYGMRNVKWISDIVLLDHDEEGYWVLRGWAREATMKATSVIVSRPPSVC